MKNVKNNKGITLMALVITIILLIILASIGTYSGIQVVKSAQFTAFSTELKIMQTQVNKLYEEKKNGNDDVDALGKTISSSSTTVQSNATKAFNALGITDTSDYKYFDTDTIKSLNIEGVEGEFLVNIDKRSVVSYDGFEYEGKKYYTVQQLPDGLYNVENNTTSQQQPDFDVDYELLENGKCKFTVSNINYNGNINKWQVKYKKEEEENWKQINSYSFTIDEVGNYRMKIANNNIESNEKQIRIISPILPSEYQQVEYIESTGTQYIDTKFSPDYNTRTICSFKITHLDEKFGIFGSRVSSSSSMYTFQKISNGKWGTSYENKFPNNIADVDLEKHVIDKNKNITYMDNEIIDTILGTQQFTTSTDMYIFCINNYGTASLFGKLKVYYTQIYNDNELVRDLIPCYRKLDKKPGMYDTVEGEFYTNQGTGDFEKGDDVIGSDNTNNDMIIIINDL